MQTKDLVNTAPEADKREKEAAWKQENAAAIASSNEWVERHGLPLEKHRQFYPLK